VLAIVTPVAVVLVVLSSSILAVWLGKKDRTAVGALRILAAY
jgi:O-antigen/teichoic acid export membrane protein